MFQMDMAQYLSSSTSCSLGKFGPVQMLKIIQIFKYPIFRWTWQSEEDLEAAWHSGQVASYRLIIIRNSLCYSRKNLKTKEKKVVSLEKNHLIYHFNFECRFFMFFPWCLRLATAKKSERKAQEISRDLNIQLVLLPL